MTNNWNRRQFLTASAGLAAGFGLLSQPGNSTCRAAAPVFKTKLHKALIRKHPTEDELKRLRDAGFEGVEAGIVPVAEAEKIRTIAEKVGMRIHSVMRGWAEFNSPDPAKVQATFKTTEDALRAAGAFGADTILLVPCRVGGMRMPPPWEFHIQFDPETGHVHQVVPGDNQPYADYIRAQNRATDTSREAVKRLIPLAEKTGVIIALENVWNNLWVQPDFARYFVSSFNSPWVRAYFDIGNHVKYTRPEKWILTLAELIVKCHVKDFRLDRSDPNGGGRFVNIRDGDVRWPIIRRALDQVGYNGWTTIEGGNLSVQEDSRRLDLILAGR